MSETHHIMGHLLPYTTSTQQTRAESTGIHPHAQSTTSSTHHDYNMYLLYNYLFFLCLELSVRLLLLSFKLYRILHNYGIVQIMIGASLWTLCILYAISICFVTVWYYRPSSTARERIDALISLKQDYELNLGLRITTTTALVTECICRLETCIV